MPRLGKMIKHNLKGKNAAAFVIFDGLLFPINGKLSYFILFPISRQWLLVTHVFSCLLLLLCTNCLTIQDEQVLHAVSYAKLHFLTMLSIPTPECTHATKTNRLEMFETCEVVANMHLLLVFAALCMCLKNGFTKCWDAK